MVTGVPWVSLPRHHEHVVALHAVIAGEDVRRQIGPGDVADVLEAVGVRPSDTNQDFFLGFFGEFFLGFTSVPTGRRLPAFSLSTKAAVGMASSCLPSPSACGATVRASFSLSPMHHHVGDLHHLGLADLVAELLVPEVQLAADPRGGELGVYLLRVGLLVLRDVDDLDLDRRRPDREVAGIVLDKDAEEALEAAEHRAVDHDRRVGGVIRTDVFEFETRRHREVELDRAALPAALERVDQVEIDLGSVESAVARIELVTAGRSGSSASLRAPSAFAQISSEPIDLAGLVESSIRYLVKPAIRN